MPSRKFQPKGNPRENKKEYALSCALDEDDNFAGVILLNSYFLLLE